MEPCSCGSCDQSSAAEASSNGAQHSEQQLQCVQPADCSLQEACPPDDGAGAAGMAAHCSNGSSSSSNNIGTAHVGGQEALEQLESGPCSIAGPGEQQPEQQLQRQVPPQQQQQQRLHKQLGQVEQAAVMEALLDYGRWSVRGPQQAGSSASTVRELVQATAGSSSSINGSAGAFVGSSSSGGSAVGCSSSNVLSAAMLGAPSALQLVLQQQQEQMLLKTAGCAAVVMATANAVVDAGSSTAGRCQ